MLPPRHRLTCVFAAALFLQLGSSAAPLRVATLNIELGLEAPGAVGHDAVAAVLTRIDADVVALQEVRSQDLASNLGALATTAGYQHIYVSDPGPLDSNNRNVFLSRLPITASVSITSPPLAKDVTRTMPAIVVDVPGTEEDPTIITMHLKCCFEPDDPFRRAVEMERIANHLTTNGLDGSDNIIVLGDTNLLGTDNIVFNSLPPGLPATYSLGSDIALPVEYSPDPAFYFTAFGFLKLSNFHADGVTTTTQGSSAVLDHILVSPSLASRPYATEIYNSALDTTFPGLPKAGNPAPANTSTNASDHFAIFADFELAGAKVLDLAISSATVSETDPPGSAVLTVTLGAPPPPGENVGITLTSSDPGEALPTQTSLTFQSGVSSLQVDVSPMPDALLDGNQSVTITASAPGYTPDDVTVTVTDANESFYTFTAPDQSIVETFDHFDGSADPATWQVTEGNWNGLDDGSSETSGNYGYGSAADPALGTLLAGVPRFATATYLNDTGSPITSLQVSYDAEQWRSALGGNPDRWTAELLIGESPTPLPALTFTASTTLPSGPVSGATNPLSTIASGLIIPPGETFQLRFTATPGSGGTCPKPSDVFLNEFHYDNEGSDIGEFVEVVVGPDFTGPLSSLSVVFYNGSDGTTYGTTHPLDSFLLGTTSLSGHRIYSKAIPGIQNGPDGIAVVENGNVLHFLSYEGAFSATSGPASGMASTNLGVSQPANALPVGEESLGLTGNGGSANDFTWVRFSGPHTPGAPNDGQTLGTTNCSQGIALDNITVTLLPDTDGDGDPDLLDPDDDDDGLLDTQEEFLGTDPLLVDSDNDGTTDDQEDADNDRQTNLAELTLTLTNPLDPNSRFEMIVAPNPETPHSASLTFPTLAGRLYTIERSHNLTVWTPQSTHPGTGSNLSVAVTGDPLQQDNLFRVVVSLP